MERRAFVACSILVTYRCQSDATVKNGTGVTLTFIASRQLRFERLQEMFCLVFAIDVVHRVTGGSALCGCADKGDGSHRGPLLDGYKLDGDGVIERVRKPAVKLNIAITTATF